MRSADGTELLERLLQDAGFRARFRHDPAAAAREAGFPELAERLAADETLSLEPLELRESRSSIGGVMLAAAVEGLGLFELADQFGDEAHAAVRPRDDGAGSALHDEAGEPLTVPDDDVEPEQDEPALAPDDATEPDEQEPDDDEPDEEEPDEEEPDEEEPDEEEPDEEEPDEDEPDEDDEDDERESVDRGEPDESDADGDQDDAGDEGESDESDGSPAPALDPGDDWRPTPDQYGMAGGGGPRSPIDAAVLDNARITLDADGRRDFASGRMDPRVGQVLLRLAEKHRITLSAATSDHAQNTAGGSPSNHWYGRAVDIATRGRGDRAPGQRRRPRGRRRAATA